MSDNEKATIFDDAGNIIGVTRGLEDVAGTGAMSKLLRESGDRIVAINEVTRDEIRGIVQKGIEEGVTMAELGERVRGSAAFTSDRAERIARTETATILNKSQVETFRSYGVERVRVLDGVNDAPCANANGEIWTVDEALGNPIGHPNCVRDFVPIVVAEQLGAGEEPFAGYTEEEIQRDWAFRDEVRWLEQHEHKFYENQPGWSELSDDGYMSYKGMGYRPMNTYLRGELDQALDTYDRIKALTDATVEGLRAQATQSKAVLWRGSSEEIYANAQVGDVLTTNIISSTSVRESVAEDFIKYASDYGSSGRSQTMVRILAPEGTPGTGMKTLEYEFTLPPDVKLRVVRVDSYIDNQNLARRRVTVEVIP